MQELKIRLRSVQDVQEFVGLATKQPYTVQVVDGHHRVNGKSFMEMFCLDFSRPLTAVAECDDGAFQKFRDGAGRFLVK